MPPRRRSDLIEEAFIEPVPMYATVKFPGVVRDLTVNGNKEVYLLGQGSVVQLDAANLSTGVNIILGSKILCA